MQPQPPELDGRADESVGLHLRYVDAFQNAVFPSALRSAIAHDAILLAMEHHAAIATLVRFRHFATAHALIRALMETTFRALWLVYVADFDSVERFCRGESKTRLG
ncbi:DUF6988 family protein [Lysobacter xanthus]